MTGNSEKEKPEFYVKGGGGGGGGTPNNGL